MQNFYGLTMRPRWYILSQDMGKNMKNLNILSAGLTDVGRKRAHNEDSLGVFDDLGLYVVADGMGGHAAGEVASRVAVDTLREYISAASGDGSEAGSDPEA